MTPQLWTVNALSNELGIDRRTLAKRLADLEPDKETKSGRGIDKSWRLARVIAHLQGPAPESDELDLSSERARLAAEQADKTALENAVRRGELLELQVVERAWQNLMVSLRARMLSLPTKLAMELANLSDANAVRGRLTDEVSEVLAEAAAHQPAEADFDGAGADRPDGADTEAAAEADRQPVGGRKAKAEPRKQRRARAVAH